MKTRQLILVCLSLLGLADPSFGFQRTALLIGCGDYHYLPKLRHPDLGFFVPHNDVDQMEVVLRTMSFGDIIKLKDPTRGEIISALSQFRFDADGSDVLFFYFSGHGLEFDGDNYLIPVEANISEVDTKDARVYGIRLSEVLGELKRADALARIVSLDCCRNTPAAKSGIDPRVYDVLSEAEQADKTLISFATSSGKMAASFLNERCQTSLYTAFLIKHLPTAGLPIRNAFEKAHDEVRSVTHGRQSPRLCYDEAAEILREMPLVPLPPPPIRPPENLLATSGSLVASSSSTSNAFPIHTSAAAPPETNQPPKYVVVFQGDEGVALRSGPGSTFKKLASAHPQTAQPLIGTGRTQHVGNALWVEVTTGGWMVARTSQGPYLQKLDAGYWSVLDQTDGFVAMRTDIDTHSPLVTRVLEFNTVKEIDSRRDGSKEWIGASLTGWMAMQAEGGTPLLTPYTNPIQ